MKVNDYVVCVSLGMFSKHGNDPDKCRRVTNTGRLYTGDEIIRVEGLDVWFCACDFEIAAENKVLQENYRLKQEVALLEAANKRLKEPERGAFPNRYPWRIRKMPKAEPCHIMDAAPPLFDSKNSDAMRNALNDKQGDE